MPNPLYSSAAELVPVQPTTRFFDPGESLGIMQRYGRSTANRAFAEDALKSADSIDRLANFEHINRRNDLEKHDRLMKVQDRDDDAYAKKKEFESTLGEFLTGIAAVSPEDPEFETKMAGYLADPAAAEHDAVKAVYNLKVSQREQWAQEQRVRADKENTLEWKIATDLGEDPTNLYTNGRLDVGKVAEAARRLQEREAQAKENKEQKETLSKALKDDAHLLDRSQEEVIGVRNTRIQNLVDAGTKQGVAVPDAKTLTETLEKSASEPAFVAQVLNLNKEIQLPDNWDGMTERQQNVFIYEAAGKDAEFAGSLKNMVRAAEETYRAELARRNVAAAPAAPSTAAQDWLNKAKAGK